MCVALVLDQTSPFIAFCMAESTTTTFIPSMELLFNYLNKKKKYLECIFQNIECFFQNIECTFQIIECIFQNIGLFSFRP